MDIETKVRKELMVLFERMENLDPASDEYKVVEDAAVKLLDRAAKMEELSIKIREMDEIRKDRWWERGLRAAGIMIPPAIALIAAFGFSVLERTDTVTSTPAREFMKRALRLS